MIRDFKVNLFGTLMGSISLGLSIFSNIPEALLWALGGVILLGFNVIWIQNKLGSTKDRKYLSSSFTFVYVTILPILIGSLCVIFLTMIWLGSISSIFLQEGIVFIPFLLLSFWSIYKIK